MNRRKRVVHYLSELQTMIENGDVQFKVNPFLDQDYAETYIANIKISVTEAINLLSCLSDGVQSKD